MRGLQNGAFLARQALNRILFHLPDVDERKHHLACCHFGAGLKKAFDLARAGSKSSGARLHRQSRDIPRGIAIDDKARCIGLIAQHLDQFGGTQGRKRPVHDADLYGYPHHRSQKPFRRRRRGDQKNRGSRSKISDMAESTSGLLSASMMSMGLSDVSTI